MKNKAQANQIFMYIVAVLVLGLIILVGYVAVSKIVPQMCDTSKITFEKHLQQTLKENRDFGTVKNEQLQLPCNYIGVCFIDTELSNNALEDTGPSSDFPPNPQEYERELMDYTDVGAAINVFYVTEDEKLEEIAIYQQEKAPINIDGKDYRCLVPSTGILNLRLRGQGRTVMLSS